MKVSAKMDYALRALVELGLHWPNFAPRQISDIGRKAGVPAKFLIHILIDLKNFGYVHSTRGKMGGYVLAIDPGKINLADLIKQLGGLGSFDEEKRKTKKDDIVSLFWREIDESILRSLRGMSLEDICDRQRRKIKAIVYDI